MTYLSPEPVAVYAEKQRPQTMADVAFAPTSTSGVEYPDDVEVDAYQANRAALSINGHGELQQLLGLDQRTTAYPSVGCTVGAMSPPVAAAPPCASSSMQERSHGITAYTPGGESIIQGYTDCRAAACDEMLDAGVGMTGNPNLVARASGEPPIGYAPNVYAPELRVQARKKSRHLTARVLNSVRGAVYDMQHFGDLPPARSGESPSSVAQYALTRDGRAPYLTLVFAGVLVVVAGVLACRGHA